MSVGIGAGLDGHISGTKTKSKKKGSVFTSLSDATRRTRERWGK